MFKNLKLKYKFLLFCVASSKGIIIYNEEMVVALSFVTFVIFSFKYFGDLIKESLDERSCLIATSLQKFHELKEQVLQELLVQHEQIQELKKIFPLLGSFTQNQVSYSSASENVSIVLYNQFSFSIQQKLCYFQSSKALLQQDVQKSLASTIPTILISKIKYNKRDKKVSCSNRIISNRVQETFKLLKKC